MSTSKKPKPPIWLSVSKCPPVPTEIPYSTEQEALDAKAGIDKTGCGSQCKGPAYHYIIYPKLKAQRPPLDVDS